MTLALKFLRNPPPSAEMVSGLDSLDPRFQSICDLYETERYLEASEEIQALVDKNILDIRLLCFDLYHVFLQESVVVFGQHCEAFRLFLQSSWDGFGPTEQKNRHVVKSVATLLEKLIRNIEYHRLKKDEQLQEWVLGLSEKKLQMVLEQVCELEGWLFDKLNSADLKTLFSSLTRELGNLGHHLENPKENAEVSVSEENKPPSTESQGDFSPTSTPDTIRPQAKLSDASEILDILFGTQGPSAELLALIRKLKAFQSLVEAKKLDRAALVGDDVSGLIQNFDPRKYFPALFANFYGDLNKNIQTISGHWQERDGIKWETLRQFYEVDLESFISQ
ncbi:MAG: type VI secretion system protein IglI family protein [Myxococcota bacterium]|nr:type VI secretion system protein IglI family protein [Myxococcota bacterium]